jgi:hypothetical protein
MRPNICPLLPGAEEQDSAVCPHFYLLGKYHCERRFEGMLTDEILFKYFHEKG